MCAELDTGITRQSQMLQTYWIHSRDADATQKEAMNAPRVAGKGAARDLTLAEAIPPDHSDQRPLPTPIDAPARCCLTDRTVDCVCDPTGDFEDDVAGAGGIGSAGCAPRKRGSPPLARTFVAAGPIQFE